MRESWRNLLEKIVEDEKLHKRLEAELNVSSITIDRWISNESNPRLHNIRALLEAPSLSSHREFRRALMDAYKIDEKADSPIQAKEIPSTLYDFILGELATRAHSLRTWGILALSLNDMAVRLEATQYHASFIISQYVPNQKTHMLKEQCIFSYTKRTTQQILEDSYLGRDSLPGIATTRGHDLHGTGALVTNQLPPDSIRSSAAFPMFRSGMIAGCLAICSEHEAYISTYFQYFEMYARLLALAFPDEAYYALADIQAFKDKE